MTDLDLTFVDQTIQKLGSESSVLIPILQAIQRHYRYLPEPALRRVCEITKITPEAIAGVSTFYSQFRHRPVGRHIIHICKGTACHVMGADLIYDAFCRHLNLQEGDDTDADELFTVQKVACLGCCSLAPVLQIDDLTYGHLTAEMIPNVLHDFLEMTKKGSISSSGKSDLFNKEGLGEIRLGSATCCLARGSGALYKAFQQALSETGVPAFVKTVSCLGMSYCAPLVEIVPPDNTLPDKNTFFYAGVQPEDAKAIILRHFRPPGTIRKIINVASQTMDAILTDASWPPVKRRLIDLHEKPAASFLDQQKHIATEYCGQLTPVDIEEYTAFDGFKALKHCLRELSPQEVIEQVRISRLRGRGGAGYSTAAKWSSARGAKGDKKYIICNGDEGDPGAFMDRSILESYPYRVIEGMIIAAYATGADEGYFYIRAEYPLAVRQIREALRQCEEKQLLGENILNSGFNLTLHIMEGAGAFVCGEETALLASIEGRRGMPRLRPPYPTQSGLWKKPTLVNNVETYAMVPWIIRHGGDVFATLGTDVSTGTKVFALAGKVTRGGLIEVPMGISLHDIVEDIGGGITAGRQLKAVQIGGPSGGCVPAELANVPVDYEALTDAGAIMGSGGLVVLDETDCMVDIARYFLEFTQDQSCGKCTFCRIGTRRMLDILERLCEGEGRKGDLEELEELALAVKKGSLCQLGGTAPNPVLSTLKYFRDEYEAHLQKKCPAGSCKALITYSITDDCIGCTRCAQHCPADAIRMTPYEKHEIDTEKCIRCGTCKNVCPSDAVKVE